MKVEITAAILASVKSYGRLGPVMATAQDIVGLNGQAQEILKRAGNGSLEVSKVRKAFQAIIEGRFDESAPGRHHQIIPFSGFTPQMRQVSNLLQWNETLNLGLTNADIQYLPQAVLDFSCDKPLVSITLCWTLGTLEETLNAKLAVLSRVHGEDKVMVSPNFKTDPVHTFLPDGAPWFFPNFVWWSVVDLGASRNLSPDNVPVADAAGVEVFDNACQHPGYLKRHNGSDVPYLDVPGLRVKSYRRSALYAPCISGNSGSGIRVDVSLAAGASSHFAEPARVASLSQAAGSEGRYDDLPPGTYM
jgi:hypothetical protein